MNESAPMTREIALRVALAARALPDMEPRLLLQVLGDITGLPPTAEKLATLTLKQLRAAAGEALSGAPKAALQTALDYLNGTSVPEMDEERPQVEPYSDGEMPGSVRIACASNRGEELDGHFGSCRRFLVYQVGSGEIRLIDVRSCEESPVDGDKNAQRAALISDCQVVFVASIGGPAAAKVVRAGVHPVKHPQGGAARARLEILQSVIQASPPPWLAKAMGHVAEQRVRFEREEAEV